MTELDRRTVVAGMTAFAVAGAAPALPILPIVDRQTPTRFARSFIDAQRAGDPRTIPLASHWHYGVTDLGEIVIRHLETGLTFIRPDPADDEIMLDAPLENLALLEFYDDQFEAGFVPLPDAAHPYGLAISLIHRAAASVALLAFYVLAARPQHQGAVFLHFRSDVDPFDPITEDAPPLPRFAL